MSLIFCLVILACWVSPVYSDAGPPQPSADSTVDDKPDMEWLIESLIWKKDEVECSKMLDGMYTYLEDLKGGLVTRFKPTSPKIPATREAHIAFMEKAIINVRAKLRKQVLDELNKKRQASPSGR
jgi:hypothetical protein